MSEHHPDMDLIMALAAGDLPPDEAARAEAGLDAEARAELAAQRAALEALEALPRPTLSTTERQGLRYAVRTQIGLETSSSRARRRRPARSPLARALPALATFASLVVVLAIALNFGDGFGNEQEPFFAPEAEAATTTAAAATTMAAVAETVPPAAATVTPAVELEAMMEEPAHDADEIVAEEAAPLPEVTTTTTAAASIESTGTTAAPATTAITTSTTAAADMPPIAFDFAADRPSDAVAAISEVLADGSMVAFPVSDLVEQAVSQGLACGAAAASGSEPDDTVYFMAYGLVDGGESEIYLILVNGAGGEEDAGLAAGIESGDLLLFSHPDCEPLGFSTP
ncbi:MAG: hypothetical protein OXF41_18015 [bacterium]|nr:hypothetical protein [bacterium]